MSKPRVVMLLSLVSLLLSSCMSSRWECPVSKGANCMMLGTVDQQVSSGEIEKVYQSRRFFGKSCGCGKSCNGNGDLVPPLAVNTTLKAKLSKDEAQTEYQEGDNLYVK